MKRTLRPLLIMLVLCAIIILAKLPVQTMMENPLDPLPAEYVTTLPQGKDVEEGVVTKVSDGDTIEIDGEEQVRLLGINTPELAHPNFHIKEQCYGPAAKARLKQLIEGRRVILEPDRQRLDRYKRSLRHVYLPTEAAPDEVVHVNAYMVGEGFAETLFIKPNTKYNNILAEWETSAKAERKGFWEACGDAGFQNTKYDFQKK